MATIYFDIETLPASDPAIIAEIEAGIRPPGNIKKAETIEAWERDEKPAAVMEAVRKTALDGTYGRILCIGHAVNDEPAECAYGDEAEVIRQFLDWLQRVSQISSYNEARQATFVGHNILAFDLRFLWQRCVVNAISPPSFIPFNAKPWDGKVFDTMVAWNPERERRVSQAKLCRALGIPSSKGELDGSKVFDFWQAGRHEDIQTYCKGDVEDVRACHRRMIFA